MFSRTQVVPLDWWPVSRDCLAYGVTVAILICIIHDERVEWYEALTLVLLYIVYIAVMYWDKSFQRCTRFRTNDDQISSDGRRVTTGEAVTLPSLSLQRRSFSEIIVSRFTHNSTRNSVDCRMREIGICDSVVFNPRPNFPRRYA